MQHTSLFYRAFNDEEKSYKTLTTGDHSLRDHHHLERIHRHQDLRVAQVPGQVRAGPGVAVTQPRLLRH
jgi:hypothetical protein